jgi:hypothetical protein
MMIKKILKIIAIILLVFWTIVVFGFVIYTYANNPTNKEDLVLELNPLLPELISYFDEANLDDPVICEETLDQIGLNLTIDVASGIEIIQFIPFQHLWDESAKQLEDLRRQAQSTGFSFSFASLNACKQEGFFKLDKPKLRQSLVDLEESVKGLNLAI